MSTAPKTSVYARTGEDTPETPSLAAIDRFLDAVWMERGLSPNTLSAYRADLTALDRWLQTHGSSGLQAKRSDVLGFIAWRVENGARPRSTARQLSIKRSAISRKSACHCAAVNPSGVTCRYSSQRRINRKR